VCAWLRLVDVSILKCIWHANVVKV
jgi:hypothetical protein